jgi:hypothetical protein
LYFLFGIRTMSDLDSFAVSMAWCLAWADLYKAGDIHKFPQERKTFLEGLIQLRGRVSDPRASPAVVPGYIVLPVADRRVHVPFHLVDSIPDDKHLLQFFELANHVRLSDESQIGISGSSVFLGRIDEVADIDFCEYVTQAPKAEAVKAKFAQRFVAMTPALFVKGKIDEFEFVRSPELSHEHTVAKIATDTRVKLDYVSLSEPFLLPLSNVSLFVDLGAPEASIRGKSWPFQEIALDENPPMFAVTRPELIGQYMAWARGEVDHYLELGDPYKALKRSLSLSRVMGCRQSEDLYQELRSSVLAVERRRNSLEEALGMAEKVADDGGRRAVEKLKKMLASEPPRPAQAEIDKGRRVCHAKVVEFRTKVDELVSMAAKTLVS